MNKISAYLLFLFCFSSCYNCKKSNNELRRKELNCIVDSIYERKEARYALTARLKCGILRDNYLFLDKYEYPILLENAEVGDRITKDSNSLLFQLIKKDGTVIEFCPVCDGEKIK